MAVRSPTLSVEPVSRSMTRSIAAEPAAPYLNPDLPIEERVDDLVARMTLEEKCGQMRYEAPAIERLGIPEYNWWNECLHGVARAGRATVFPQAVNMAAAFDPELLGEVASAIALEGRAKHHAAAAAGNRGKYRGLTFWTPNINIFRDPRWGRGQETYGEDPHLTATLGAAFVKGLQGDGSDNNGFLRATACAKHFAVHSGPEGLRHEFDARPPKKDFHETYLPAFRALAEAGVESFMGAYNRVYGEPACGSKLLLQEILRGRWGFEGHVVSDCWAIRDFHEHHGVTGDIVESAALAVNNGCDLNCGEAFGSLLAAVDRGLVSEETIDRAVRRLMRARFRLGMFDPPERVPLASTPLSVVGSEEHRALARRAATAGVVLLKNNGVLPLRRDLRRMFLLGPNAASAEVLLGNYYGQSDRLVTVLEAITAACPEGLTLEYRPGYLLDRENPNPIDWSPFEAKLTDVSVFVGGLQPIQEGEEGEALVSTQKGDRERIELPRSQINALRGLKAGGKPVVLVLTGGSPIALGEAAEIADAILWIGYPGEQGGYAAADVLFGEANPAGRLPVTWPKRTEDLPPFEDYSMRGRTYRYADAEPLYPFGFGLSYTSFTYEGVRLSGERIGEGGSVQATVRVRNTGERDGDEVVQLYVRREGAGADEPRWTLRGFRRLTLAAGETRETEFWITTRDLAGYDAEGREVLRPGRYEVVAAGAVPTERARALGAAEPARAWLTVG